MVYPGRIIIIGKDITDNYVITVYAVTGRSSSSQARKIEYSSGRALVKPTDTKKIKKGNRDLLIYPALRIKNGLAVSNGKHTEDIYKRMKKSSSPVKVLSEALKSWDYESDPPNFTPRISGCFLTEEKAALSIIKRSAHGHSLKNFYEFPLVPGKGKMISTYKGPNKDPLPCFEGEPMDIDIQTPNPEETAQYLFQWLEPKKDQPDFRVALICVFSRPSEFQKSRVFIINRSVRSE